ncbi:MAG: hypothetical protein JSR78_08595 [Proteobacteria bacterium]|nr:hypothetical protein [Pseudomonadota bacterium]
MANCSLSNSARPLVIDTSVTINLTACGLGSRLLLSLDRPILVVRTVIGELEDGGERGQIVLTALDQWRRDRLIDIVDLQGEGCDLFEDLISGGTIDTLDDGEAATIAHARQVSGVAVIDDGKANRIAAQRFPELPLASTVDLISNERAIADLGQDAIADALFGALVGARMRVLPRNISMVVQLLGPRRTAQCHSLPRFVRPL